MAGGPSTRRWLLPVAVALFILVASLVPVSPGGPSPDTILLLPADKFGHLVSYAVLAAVTVLTSRHDSLAWRDLILVAVGVTLFGAGIEVLQAFVPTRQFSVGDMAANGIGALGGVLVGRWLRERIGAGWATRSSGTGP